MNPNPTKATLYLYSNLQYNMALDSLPDKLIQLDAKFSNGDITEQQFEQAKEELYAEINELDASESEVQESVWAFSFLPRVGDTITNLGDKFVVSEVDFDMANDFISIHAEAVESDLD